MVRSLPNYLTLFRLALIPAFVALMIDPTETMIYLATLIFVIAAITDFIDGMIARRYGAVSDFGKLLDPLADKMLVSSALIMLVAQRTDEYGEPWVPGWLVVLIMLREIWITGLRAMAAGQGRIVSASNGGKLKSAFQMIAIVFLLLHNHSLQFLGVVVPFQFIGFVLLSISLVFSYWAAGEYTYDILLGGVRGAGISGDAAATSTESSRQSPPAE